VPPASVPPAPVAGFTLDFPELDAAPAAPLTLADPGSETAGAPVVAGRAAPAVASPTASVPKS